MDKNTKAKTLFSDGCNCCQAVAMAFADEMNTDTDALMRLSSSFGGGMGGLGEVCGAVSGMFMVLGATEGYGTNAVPADKQLHYARIRAAAEMFCEKYGSLLCRELKSPEGGRTFCAELVGFAAELCTDFLQKEA